MRAIEFIWTRIRRLTDEGYSSKEVSDIIRGDEFKKEFTDEYKYDTVDETVRDMGRELERFGKTLKSTLFKCVGGNDGDLQYYYQCQECGNITQIDNSSSDCVNYDLVCTTCNAVEDKAVFELHELGTLSWIQIMLLCEHRDKWRDENTDEPDYISGSVKGCKFQITKWMRLKYNAVNNYYRVLKYLEPVYNYKEWKKKKEANKEWLADLGVE